MLQVTDLNGCLIEVTNLREAPWGIDESSDLGALAARQFPRG